MRYWAHINNEVRGPFETERLPGTPGFTPATLVCPETPPAGEPAAWKAASSVPEISEALARGAAPAPEPPKAAPPAEDKLMLTMRGSLIDPEFAAAMQKAQPAPKPAAAGAAETPKEQAPAAPAPDPREAGRRARLERLAAEAAAIARAQAELAGRLESVTKELKELTEKP